MNTHKTTTSIALTPELLASIKREPVNITAQVIQDTTGWTLTKSTLGWIIGCSKSISIRWTGEENPESLHINIYNQEFEIERMKNGIIGFRLPWLFKTGCPSTGLSIRNIPNIFNSHIGIIDTIYKPSKELHEIMIYWKILTTNEVLTINSDYSLGLLQPYNLELWQEASLTMEKYNANYDS